MIVETDFPDHWKTQFLIQLTQDQAAPMMMIRLWAHCQMRKAWRFSDMSDQALAAICRWKGDTAKLRANLIESGYVTEETKGQVTWLVVHDFEVVNATLVRNWENGAKHAKRETQPEPNGNPAQTQEGGDRVDRGEGLDKSEGGDRGSGPAPAGGGKGKRSSKSTKPRGASVLPSDQPEPKRGRVLALNAIFRRPPSDAWSAAEQLALEASGLLQMAELDFVDAAETVRAFYHASIPREIEKKFWKRTTLQTLLENWGEQADKARAWARERDDGIRKV